MSIILGFVLRTTLDCQGQSGVPGQIRGVKTNVGRQDGLDMLGASVGVLRLSLDRASRSAPWPIKPMSYTRDATELLLQFNVLCNVAGKQQEHTSTMIL